MDVEITLVQVHVHVWDETTTQPSLCVNSVSCKNCWKIRKRAPIWNQSNNKANDYNTTGSPLTILLTALQDMFFWDRNALASNSAVAYELNALKDGKHSVSYQGMENILPVLCHVQSSCHQPCGKPMYIWWCNRRVTDVDNVHCALQYFFCFIALCVADSLAAKLENFCIFRSLFGTE